ncbi:MAG: AAA family ATPase [Atopobiaceae bacterium]|nr:AAA family ATPase [Atopobiaceae bacterium]
MATNARQDYPLSAIVGQDDMKLALCLVSVQPAIGGVLIYGERGTAKTTAVRALPGLLGGDTRVIELPLNASEDRVVGTLQLGTLMKSGEREFVPGLMAEADGNILYVDEINLLEDSIVDLLLDAAATGVCRVEREGMSLRYPARFVLIGTMNPEEGTLRPQLLDRFGLSVKVSGSLGREERLELIRRHAAFEHDPAAFVGEWQGQEDLLARRIRQARALYPDVTIPDDAMELAVGLCAEFEVDGYRGDITMMRAARAAAALEGRTSVTEDDVLLAARFVLPHRLKKLPFEDMGMTDAMLEKAAATLSESLEPTPVVVPVQVVVEGDEPVDGGGEDDAKKG